jgi:hypothetical protein
MAYNFVRASSQALTAQTIASNIAPPFTMVGLFAINNTIDSQGLFTIYDGLNPTDRHILIARGAAVGDPIEFGSATNDGVVPTGGAISNVGYQQDVTVSVVGFSETTADRTIRLNNLGSATNTTNVPLAGINKIAIGAAVVANALSVFLSGKASECALWAAALTDAEIVSLAKGFKPTRIRPQSLVFYAPLVRNLQDLRGALAITNVNTATVADHPRVY